MARRIILIISLTVLSILIIVLLGASVALNFVFTPEKVTPLVSDIVKEYVKSDVSVGSIELRFFSSFPRFSAKINSLQVKQLNDTLPDLVVAEQCVIEVDPIAFLNKKVKVSRLHLVNAEINVIIDSTYTPLDIFAFETDTTAVDTLQTNALEGYEFEISGVEIDSSYFTLYNNIENQTLKLDDINLNLDGNLNEKLVDFNLFLSWADISLSRNDRKGGLRGVAFSIDSKMNFNRDSLLLTLDKTNININEIALTASGTLRADSTKSKLFVDLNNSLSTPSLTEFLHLIPRFIIKEKNDITTSGSVNLDINVNGEYSKESMPDVKAELLINDAMAKYNSRKVWLENVNCDAMAYVSFNEPKKSYVDINKFTVSSTKIIDLETSVKIVNLFDNPYFNITLDSYIDFNRLSEVFPLENNITLEGTNTSKLNVKFALNDIETSNYGKIYIGGESSFDNVIISMTNDSIMTDETTPYIHVEMNKGLLNFGENVNSSQHKIIKNASLLSSIDFTGIGLKDKDGNFVEIKNLNLFAATSFDKNSSEVTGIDVKFNAQDLYAGVVDSIDIGLKTTSAKLLLFPANEKSEARIKTTIETDSMYVYEVINNSDIALSKANINLEMLRLEPKVWDIDGTVGFSNFQMYSDLFPLELNIPRSSITLTDSKEISLKNTNIKVGNSVFMTTGTVTDLLKVLFTTEKTTVKGTLTLNSRTVDVTELIEAINQSVLLSEETSSEETNTSVTSTESDTTNNRPKSTKVRDNSKNEKLAENRPTSEKSTKPQNAPNARSGNGASGNMQSFRNNHNRRDSLGNRMRREPIANSNMILVPQGVDLTLNLDLHNVKYDSVLIDRFKGVATVKKGIASFNDIELEVIGAKATSSIVYKNTNRRKSNAFIDLNIKQVDINRIGGLLPSIDSLMPMLKSFEGIVDFDLKAITDINSDMIIELNTLKSAMSLDGQQLVLMDSETFTEISNMLKFKNKDRNLIDSLSVDIIINDSKIDVLPFEVVIDRYRAIIGGSQSVTMSDNYDFDINFNYNVSIMKSPLPFKAGVDVFGDLEDYDFKITKAKLKKTDFELLDTDFNEFKSTIK